MSTAVLSSEDGRIFALNRITWGAVLAGVVLALVIQLMFNLLGVGIGVAAFDSRAVDNVAAGTFSIAAGVWYVVAGIIAAFAGGYFAGRLSGSSLKSVAAFHGITTWAVTTLVVLYLLTTAAGSLIGGVFSTVGGAIGGLGRTAATVVETAVPTLAEAADPFNAIEQEIRRATGNDPQALRDAAIAAVRTAFTGNEELEAARGRAAEALAKAQNISVEQARAQVQRYEEQYRAAVAQARQRATEAADIAAAVVSRGALFGFFALLLGAVAGWLGGSAGTVAPAMTAGVVVERGRDRT